MKTDPRSQPARRLRIERLELDLHGVAPSTAEAAAHILGPALAQALVGRLSNLSSAERMDAGRIGLAGKMDATTLAGQLAQRIADRITGD